MMNGRRKKKEKRKEKRKRRGTKIKELWKRKKR